MLVLRLFFFLLSWTVTIGPETLVNAEMLQNTGNQ